MSRTHRDPTGLTAAQARREAEALFTKHETFGHVYAHDVMEASPPVPCAGQLMSGGMRPTRGCGHAHLQPCPGGPLIYSIRRYTSMFCCIEASGDSWRDALDRIIARRKEERDRADAYRAERKKTQKARSARS